jgi:hypothetical protein
MKMNRGGRCDNEGMRFPHTPLISNQGVKKNIMPLPQWKSPTFDGYLQDDFNMLTHDDVSTCDKSLLSMKKISIKTTV